MNLKPFRKLLDNGSKVGKGIRKSLRVSSGPFPIPKDSSGQAAHERGPRGRFELGERDGLRRDPVQFLKHRFYEKAVMEISVEIDKVIRLTADPLWKQLPEIKTGPQLEGQEGVPLNAELARMRDIAPNTAVLEVGYILLRMGDFRPRVF